MDVIQCVKQPQSQKWLKRAQGCPYTYGHILCYSLELHLQSQKQVGQYQLKKSRSSSCSRCSLCSRCYWWSVLMILCLKLWHIDGLSWNQRPLKSSIPSSIFPCFASCHTFLIQMNPLPLPHTPFVWKLYVSLPLQTSIIYNQVLKVIYYWITVYLWRLTLFSGWNTFVSMPHRRTVW